MHAKQEGEGGGRVDKGSRNFQSVSRYIQRSATSNTNISQKRCRILLLTPFQVIGLVPSKYSNVPFLIQIAPSRVTHERNIIFARTPCKVYTNWHRKLLLKGRE